MLGHEKLSKPSPFDKKLKNHAQDLAQAIFNDSISPNQELDFNGPIFYFSLSQVFLICSTKQNMHDKNKDTKNFYVTGENIFQMAIFRQYCQELYFESLWWNFFEHIVNEFLLLIYFTKKPHHKCSTVFHKMQHKSYSTCFIFIISNNNAITIRN